MRAPRLFGRGAPPSRSPDYQARATFRALVAESGLFDAAWYVARYPDVATAGGEPLDHLVAYGAAEGRDPGPRFEGAYYLRRYPEAAGSGLSPLQHYLQIGRARGAATSAAYSPEKDAFRALLLESGLFDPTWYRARYADVAKTGQDPLDHIVADGAAEGRDPGPGFKAAYYVAENPDAAVSGMSPLEHYLRVGRGRGASPLSPREAKFRTLLIESGLFDAAWYLARNPDVRRTGQDPLDHLLGHGATEHRDPGPGFEAPFYTEQNPEALSAEWSPLEHYLLEGRDAGFQAKGPPLYQRWTVRYDELTAEDRAQIEADARAVPLPPLACLHVSPAGAMGSADAGTYHIAQVGAAPASRVIGHQAGAVGVAHALDGLANGTVLILSGGAARLRAHAVYTFANTLRRTPALAAYSDHDHVDPVGTRMRPVFKPAMSPDFMTRQPYAGPVIAIHLTTGTRPAILRALAEAADDSTRAFAALLLSLDPSQVARVPMPLFALPGQALDPAAYDAIEEVYEPVAEGAVEPEAPALPDPPQVRLLIPTRDRWELLKDCIDSIRERTDYPRDRLRIVVIDNDSREPESLAYLARLAADPGCTVVPSPGPFNFAAICNDGAAGTDGAVLVFLNNDMTVREADWLRTLVAHAIRPEIGVVGTQLLYPDDTVQHGGVILGLRGIGGHRLIGMDAAEAARLDVTREMAAVTGACIALRRAVFEAVGGFDPVLGVAFNDVALCVRALQAGYRNLYVARPLLYHHESKSRGYDDSRAKVVRNTREAIYARERFGAVFQADPSYSPNLSLEKAGALAVPPRVMRPWRRAAAERRVLLLSVAHGIGHGVAFVLALQAEHFIRRGWSVTVGGPISKADRTYSGCRRVDVRTAMDAAALATADGFDCIVSHTPPFFSVTRHLGHRPLVYAYDHGEPPPGLFDNVEAREDVDWEKRFCAPLARRVFAISATIHAEQFRRDAVVLRNGNSHLAAWTPDWAERRPALRRKFGFEGRFVILNVCRFHAAERRYKGIDAYMTLAAEAPYAVPGLAERAVFALAGRAEGADVAYVRAAGLSAFPNVTDREMAELYAASDLYVSLSQWEGYNLGIGQALAMGLDVVASDIPAHREFGVPTASAPAGQCRLIEDAFARWKAADAEAPPRAARIESWDVPLTRMIDLIEEDVAADATGSWL